MSDIWPFFFDKVMMKVVKTMANTGSEFGVFFMLLNERASRDFGYLLSVCYCGSNESEEKTFAASGDSLFKLVLSGVPLLGKLLNRLIRELQNTKKHIHSCQDPVLIENKSRTWTIFLANWASLTVLNFFQFGCFRAS